MQDWKAQVKTETEQIIDVCMHFSLSSTYKNILKPVLLFQQFDYSQYFVIMRHLVFGATKSNVCATLVQGCN